MIFSQRIKELRIQKGISQDELAKHFKISRSAIANYEQGTRKPDYELLESMADYFNVDMDYLLGRTNENKSSNSIRILNKILALSEENRKLIETMVDKLIEKD